jgi:hypothetical protein
VEINEPRVRDAGGKVRRVGDDADSYLNQILPKMMTGSEQNQCLASAAALKQVMETLQVHAKGLAGMSRTLGDNVVTAADNHELNDIRKARVFRELTPSGSETGR